MKFALATICLITSLISTPYFPAQASGASLWIDAPNSVRVGQHFEVDVRMSSPQAANALELEIAYPAEVSLQKTGTGDSVVKLWVEAPHGGDGSIRLVGGTPNPGFDPTRSEIVRLYFRAEKVGNYRFDFVKSLLLANDGQGTAIPVVTQSSKIIVLKEKKLTQPQAPLPAPVETPSANQVDSLASTYFA